MKLKKAEAALDAAKQYSHRDDLVFSGVLEPLLMLLPQLISREHAVATLEIVLDLWKNVPVSFNNISVAHKFVSVRRRQGLIALPSFYASSLRSFVLDKVFRA